jgi:hypothetical protein
MSVHDHQLRDSIGFHPRESSDKERRKREAVLRIAEKHFTVDEFSELMAAMSDEKVDVRIYDDGIVLMRQF